MSVVLIVADRAGESQVALARGITLAEKLGHAVQVVAFAYEALGVMGIRTPSEQASARNKILARRKAEVEAEIARHNPHDLPVATTLVWQKDIHHWLIRQCARKSYAVLIRTGHRTDRFFYTRTDWQLLRECPVPVMIVAEKKWRSTRPVVAAIDVNTRLRVKQSLNHDVIATAKRYAEALDAPLYILQALHIPAILTELDLVDGPERSHQLKREMAPKLEKLSEQHGIALKQFRMKQGPVDRVITSEAARLKAQLLVMGTVGRKGVKAKLLGNMAESVLTRVRTDVLALKP